MPDDPQPETPPKWFYDEHGRRLGVIANERARAAWHAERGVPDPAHVSATLIANSIPR